MMTDKDTIRKELAEMLDELTSQLNRIEEDIRHQESPVNTDSVEQATASANDEVLHPSASKINATIKNIKNTMRRMEDGTYGFCAVCGAEIVEERIKALPCADICFACAEK